MKITKEQLIEIIDFELDHLQKELDKINAELDAELIKKANRKIEIELRMKSLDESIRKIKDE